MTIDNIIAINVDLWETRVALIENGMIAELLVERTHERSRVGNVYRGRVSRVLPGIQAAFVDIGFEKHAFLHASDVASGIPGEDVETGGDDDSGAADTHGGKGSRRDLSIRDSLTEGQYIPVQVYKDQIGTKGCRITTEISLPGRHLVYMPKSKRGGISRKIEDEAERKRLSKILKKIQAPRGSIIARTAAADASPDALEADAAYLWDTWEDIRKVYDRTQKPELVYADLSLPLRVARDRFNDNIARIFVDNEGVLRDLQGFIDRLIPSRFDSIVLYTDDEPIFEAFGIETEIRRALDRVVELPSGGTLVIDQGEALTAVDVNTGKNVGRGFRDQEDTILQTNLEAVAEIAYQMRFRNIGGLIVLDLIDMDRSANRQKVLSRLKEALKEDRAKTAVIAISRFGLIEMTRERTTESLGRMLHENCPFCDGTGHILSRMTVTSEILRHLQTRKDVGTAMDVLEVTAHPNVIDVLQTISEDAMKALKQRQKMSIQLTADRNMHPEKYVVHVRKTRNP